MTVNLVTGPVRVDWVLADLLARLRAGVSGVEFVQTEAPVLAADVYHYYRPQAAVGTEDLSRAVLTCHGIGKRNKVQPNGSVAAADMYGPEDMAAFRRARLTLTLNSLDERALAEAGLRPEQIMGVPHAVDPDVFTLRPEHSPDTSLVIGVVGRPYGPPDDENSGEEQKGRATLRAIMRELQPEAERITWLFLGANWEDEVRLVGGYGYATAFVRRDDVQYPEDFVAAYHRMDVYLVTSRSEGGPASLPEAMACGVWPICTPVGMCADLVGSGTGDLYPINGHDAAADLIRAKFSDRAGLEDAREAVREKVAGWTWSEWAKAHLEAYERVAQI